MISRKEFNGPEFHAFCQQQYDEARRYLKNCGKPKDDIERFFIEKYKDDVKIFGGMLNGTTKIQPERQRCSMCGK